MIDFLKAFYAAAAATPLGAALTGGLHYGRAVQKTPPPYGVYFLRSGWPDDTFDAAVDDLALQVNLYARDGVVDFWDEDGISNINISGLSGEVGFESLELVDRDVDCDMGSESIQYTIADSTGATSSADLSFSFTNTEIVPEVT